jgi:hypothetical protein
MAYFANGCTGDYYMDGVHPGECAMFHEKEPQS